MPRNDSPKEKTVRLRGLLFNRAGRWVAQCLDVDIVAQGSTLEEVIHELTRILCVHIHMFTEAGKDPFEDAPGAPAQLVQLYNDGWETTPPKQEQKKFGDHPLELRMAAAAYA